LWNSGPNLLKTTISRKRIFSFCFIILQFIFMFIKYFGKIFAYLVLLYSFKAVITDAWVHFHDNCVYILTMLHIVLRYMQLQLFLLALLHISLRIKIDSRSIIPLRFDFILNRISSSSCTSLTLS
jgi:hypothetical protein